MTRFRLSSTLLSALVGILIIAVAPCFITVSLLNALTFIAIYTVLVVGLNLLMGYAGQVSLGHAAFFGIGAYSSAILTLQYHWSPWLAMLAGMVLAAAVALLVGIPCLRLHGHYLAMATLGFGWIVFIVMREWTEVTQGPSGIEAIPKLALGSFVFDTDVRRFYLTWAFAILTLVLSANIVNSRVGRALRAIHGSEAAAATLGVNIASYKIQVFMLSAIYAALAGSLYAHVMNFISPATFGFIQSVGFVVMVVIGGMASIWGALFGAGTIVMLGEGLQDLGRRFPAFAEFDIIAHGAILILVMIFMPSGIVCSVRDAVVRWLRMRTTALQPTPARVEEVATK
jgi:branched-chain amino acid transport system permease protein